ncbi:MAG: hypothetical protein ACFNM7_12935, partial [Prevotella conceptionensis]
MKRTLYTICALAMSLTAFAQKLDTPKGKLIDNMYRTSDSWVKRNWTSTEPGRYEGLVSKIVVGDDNCLYVYNPLSGLDSKSWLKLDKIGEGKYRANLPQVIYKDDNGDDDDDMFLETVKQTVPLIPAKPLPPPPPRKKYAIPFDLLTNYPDGEYW